MAGLAGGPACAAGALPLPVRDWKLAVEIDCWTAEAYEIERTLLSSDVVTLAADGTLSGAALDRARDVYAAHAIAPRLATFEARLASGRVYIVGDGFSLADAALSSCMDRIGSELKDVAALAALPLVRASAARSTAALP